MAKTTLKAIPFVMIAILAAAALLEFFVLPGLEDEKRLAASGWVSENKQVFQQNAERNQATAKNALWRSTQLPVAVQRRKQMRILAMGDSFVWGDGYANVNDIWWRQLERELVSRGYDQVEVIAAGHCGDATHNELDWAKTIVPTYKPDLIVWAYLPDDPDEELIKAYKQSDDPGFEKFDHALSKIAPNIACELKILWYRLKTSLKAGSKRGYDYSDWELKLLEGKNLDQYKITIDRLAAFQKQSQIPGFMVTTPPWPDKEFFETRFSKVEPLFRSAGMPFYDLTNALCQRYGETQGSGPSPEWSINPANPHPGPKYTHFFASQIADILQSHYGQRLGPQSKDVNHDVHINDYLPVQIKLNEDRPGHAQFTYPDSDKTLLHMPLRKPFVQLNLEEPANLSDITLSGAGLRSATIYLTGVDEKEGYDDGKVFCLPGKQGTSLTWHLSRDNFPKAVNTIRVSPELSGKDRQLAITLTPKS